MPFKSQAQEKWAFSTHQPWAKKWAHMTNQKDLPEKKHPVLKAIKERM